MALKAVVEPMKQQIQSNITKLTSCLETLQNSHKRIQKEINGVKKIYPNKL